MDAVVLLGAPGSGKGTQTAKLCEEFNYNRVSTGDIIRFEIRERTLFGKTVEEYQAKGLLVPDDTVCEMVFSLSMLLLTSSLMIWRSRDSVILMFLFS